MTLHQIYYRQGASSEEHLFQTGVAAIADQFERSPEGLVATGRGEVTVIRRTTRAHAWDWQRSNS